MSPHKLRQWCAALVIFCGLLPAQVVGQTNADNSEAEREQKRKNLVVAPWILSTPSFGNGAGLMGLYFHRPQSNDTVSPPSSLSLMGAYSDTDSYVAALISQNYLNNDYWRLSGGLVHAEINNDLNIDGLGKTEFTTIFGAVSGRSLWRVYGDWFLGVHGGFFSVSYEEGNAASKTYFQNYDVGDSDSLRLGFAANYDTRDHQRYPHQGTLAELTLTFHPEDLGAEESYQVLEGSINHFIETVPDQVLALRSYGRFTPSGTPYSGLSTLGRRSDLRGYTSSENVAENILSTQVEYRWMFAPRWGVVGFAGVAGLYDGGPGNIDTDNLFVSGGAGLRYLLNPENRVNFRVDFAFGENDEDGLYVSLRESF